MGLLIVGMIIIHELIHYGIGVFLGLGPKFRWEEYILLKNPSIVVFAEGIKRWHNLAMLSGPFVLMGTVCLLLMISTDGVVASSAALILLLNSAVSGQDLYHIARLLLMPVGTQFANYSDGDDLRTEYVVPQE